MKKKKIDIELTELFMAQADKYRCFYGTIRRDIDALGKPIVFGKIKVDDGYIYAMAGNRDELGKRLDEIVIMILDKSLHSVAGKSIKIFDADFFLN